MRARRHPPWRGAIAIAALFVPAGCWGDPTTTAAPYVHVLTAVQQPQSSNLGVIVDVQAGGGNFLSLVADQGTVRLLETGDGGAGATGSCIPIGNNEIMSFLVTPTQSEAILFANLYSLSAPPDAGGPDAFCLTRANPVATSVTPIAHAVNNVQADAAPSGLEDAGDAGESMDAAGVSDGGGDATLKGAGGDASPDAGKSDSATGGG